MLNVFKSIIKVFDGDDKPLEGQLEWITENGNKLKLDENGNVVAGQTKAIGGAKKLERQFNNSEIKTFVNCIDFDAKKIKEFLNNLKNSNNNNKMFVKNIVSNLAKEFKHSELNDEFIDDFAKVNNFIDKLSEKIKFENNKLSKDDRIEENAIDELLNKSSLFLVLYNKVLESDKNGNLNKKEIELIQKKIPQFNIEEILGNKLKR